MFTHSVKFFKNKEMQYILPQLSNPVEEGKTLTFYEAVKIRNWALEYFVKVEKEDGTYSIKDLLEGCEEKHPDIMYNFFGKVSIVLKGEIYEIKQETFSRLFPFYISAIANKENVLFQIKGAVFFGFAVLNSETRYKVKQTAFQVPFNNRTLIRYVDGDFITTTSSDVQNLFNRRQEDEMFFSE